MKTKEEVIAFVEDELIHNNDIIVYTSGNGGAGLDAFQTQDEDAINDIVSNLKDSEFRGPVEDEYGLKKYSPEDDCEVYEFDKDGFILQVLVF